MIEHLVEEGFVPGTMKERYCQTLEMLLSYGNSAVDNRSIGKRSLRWM